MIQTRTNPIFEMHSRMPQSAWAEVVITVANTLLIWDLRRRTRAALKKLSDDQLNDIGLSHDAAFTESRRKFWQG